MIFAIAFRRLVSGFRWLWQLIQSLPWLNRKVAELFQYASQQAAGLIGSRNSWHRMIANAEVPSIEMGPQCRIRGYNAYRELCGMRAVTDFDQITADEEVQQVLSRHYGDVDSIEFYTGIFSEDLRPDSALAPLIGTMVAVDAFSQALNNPLLQPRIWNKETFSPRGWDIIFGETHTIESLVKRNSPELTRQARDRLSITMTRPDWRHS